MTNLLGKRAGASNAWAPYFAAVHSYVMVWL